MICCRHVTFAILITIITCTSLTESLAQRRTPLPAGESDRIWVFEQGAEPTSVPFDASITSPGLTIYRGIIKNTNGTAAAGAGFYARMTPIFTGMGQTASGGVPMVAGSDGRFHFALKRYSSNGIYMMGEDPNGTQRSQEEFPLTAGKENVIISRLKLDLPVHLILANGREMGKNDVPAQVHQLPSYSSIGKCKSMPPGQPYSDAELYYQKDNVATPFIIRRLAVPGRYSLMAMGRVFKPFSVETTQTEATLYEDARPFVLRGTVQQPDGSPVKSAIIIVDNDTIPSQQLLEKSFQSVESLWNETSGDFNKLGYYMARTTDAGKVEIRGACLTDFANLYVFADGFGIATLENFLPDHSTADNGHPISHRPFNHSQIWNSHGNYSKSLFTGETEVLPITIARQATLKIQVMGTGGLLKRSDWIVAHIITDALSPGDNSDRWPWLVNTEWTPSGGQFTVPAEIPFKLVLRPGAKVRDSDVIVIDNPLQPGEVRDLGQHKLNLLPVQPGSL